MAQKWCFPLALAPALAGGVLTAAGATAAGPAGGTSAGLVSNPVKAGIQVIMSPNAAEWRQAPAFEVRTSPQLMTPPHNPAPSVEKLAVRSLHSEESGWIAFRIEWRDATKDDTPRPGQWADVLAIEFPADPKNPPAPMMGHRPGGRVQIIQWRADWQKDIDKGETTIRDLYPNAVVDAPVEKVYRYADVQAFSAGRAIGNIVSQARHYYAVQDLMAEGFGTLTPKPVQNALGKGVWEKGTWKVVIARPMEAVTDPDAAPLIRYNPASIGFAVWNGSADERGARKGWAGWIPLAIR